VVDASRRRYWIWVARPEDYLDEDGRDHPELSPDRESAEHNWWTCHRETQAGDLVLLYRSQVKKDLGYLIRATSAAYPIGDEELAADQGWDVGCDYQVMEKFQRPLRLADMRNDPELTDWGPLRVNFVRRVHEVSPAIWNHLLTRLDPRCEAGFLAPGTTPSPLGESGRDSLPPGRKSADERPISRTTNRAGRDAKATRTLSSDDDPVSRWDFFISYTKADLNWAEWIAWQLEDSGYQVLFQAWDFVPGSHWTVRMGQGIREAEHTLAILSNEYMSSVYGDAEWRAAYGSDPRGFARKLIPVRVEDCPRPDLLGAVVSFDLFDLSLTAARDRLINQIQTALMGRAKPTAEPPFPGRLGPIQHQSEFVEDVRATDPISPYHAGKYRALWAWLRAQEGDRLPATFADVEKVLGMRLPPSSRKHPAHWSGYDGSAVARAIRDAGWAAKDVDIRGERLTFVRRW
jgi:hypothetical protein